jgi:hypothetical protein
MGSGQKNGAPEFHAHRARRETLRPNLWGLLACFFIGREASSEAVTTRARFAADPESVWNRILFYEEVPGPPPLLLRILLTCPRRTEGDKTVIGSRVRCVYNSGYLIKRITALEPRREMRFEVIEQKLGIERCVIATGGSYEIRSCNDGADVALTTHYLSRLRPRSLWRPLEKSVARRLHWHILNGMRSAVSPVVARMEMAAPANAAFKSDPAGGYPCTNSPSRLRR